MQVTMDAFVAYNDYTRSKIEQRRAEPTDDLISVLVHAEVDGERLTDDDILQESLLILVGGDETTRHTISGGTEQLLRHRDQWDLLRNDPDLLPGAIEEMLRWTSPLKNMCRTLTADTEFHGTQLHEGEKIMLMFESANFDEAVFGDPDNFRDAARPEQPLGVWLRHALLPGQPAGPHRAGQHDQPGAAAAAGSAAGRRRRVAAAAGELRQRPGVDAGGIHPDQASC